MSTFQLNEPQVLTPDAQKQVEIHQDPNETTSQEQVNKPKEVIIKGPLGHGYTEVLNILLDKKTNPDREIRQESVYQALQANVLVDEAESDANTPDDMKAYVYVYDGKKMGMGQLSEMFEEVTAKKESLPEGGYVSALVENAQEILDQPNLAAPFEKTILAMESMKVNFHFTQEASLNSLANFLRK